MVLCLEAWICEELILLFLTRRAQISTAPKWISRTKVRGAGIAEREPDHLDLDLRDNSDVLGFIAKYHEWLAERYRGDADWAATQMNLGTALQTFGERESGTARLEAGGGGLPGGAGGEDARAGAARMGGDADEPRYRAPDARGAGKRDGAAGGGGGGLPGGAGGVDARAGAARLGEDADEPRQRASDARGAGKRDGAAGSGGGGLPGGAGGADARAGAAPMGGDADGTSATRS